MALPPPPPVPLPRSVEFTRFYMYVMATMLGGFFLLSSCLNLVFQTDTPNAEAQQVPLAFTFLIVGVVFIGVHVAAARGIGQRQAWGRYLGIGVSGVVLFGLGYLIFIRVQGAFILVPGYGAVFWILLRRGDVFHQPPTPTAAP
jgi:peptidoglycan/LPS O-acetylase OafA/YrhL